MSKRTANGDKSNSPCPSCGYCPTCGRKNAAPTYWPTTTTFWPTTTYWTLNTAPTYTFPIAWSVRADSNLATQE